MNKKLLLSLLALFSFLGLRAQDNYFEIPSKGVANYCPSSDYNHACLSGNGDMGIMVKGDVHNETIVINQRNIFLPINDLVKPIDQLTHLNKIKSLLLEGKGEEATLIPVQESYKEGYNGQIWSDPFVPAIHLNTKITAQNVEKYLRTTNFENGQISIDWLQNNQKFSRKAFVSRKDSVIVINVNCNTGKFDTEFSFNMPSYNWDQVDYINQNIKKTDIKSSGDFVVYSCEFQKQWNPNIIGYQGLMTIKDSDGKVEVNGNKISVKDASNVTLVIKVEPLWFKQTSKEEKIKSWLNGINKDYKTLLENHQKIHSEIFNRVKLDLNGDNHNYQMFGSVISQNAKNTPNKAYVQKQFEAARYHLICCSGPNIPCLQGIWSNTWTPPWSSDYTNNGNVQTAISSYLSANMMENMMDFFKFEEARLPYYRENAQRLYGCKGIHVPSHNSSHGYDVHFDKTWCMTFWTGGAAWFSQYFWDYYQYTLDIDFLKKHAYPFMKESVTFYEDFLEKGKDGKYIFNPSYSPENNPKNNPSQACINATMDISMAKELLRNIIKAGTILKENKALIARWQKMLNNMPEYQVDKNGYFREWLWDGVEENHHHRHVSHLYGLYNTIDPEIQNSQTLMDGVKKAYNERMKIRIQDGGGVMVFGLCQMAWIAANLGDKEMYTTIVNWLSAHYFTDNLFTFHDPNNTFNADLTGGFQNTIIKGLVYSELDHFNIFPSKPDAWDKGEISGIRLRGNLEIQSLKWDDSQKTISIAIMPYSNGNFTINLPKEILSISGSSNKKIGEKAINFMAKKGVLAKFDIKLK